MNDIKWVVACLVFDCTCVFATVFSRRLAIELLFQNVRRHVLIILIGIAKGHEFVWKFFLHKGLDLLGVQVAVLVQGLSVQRCLIAWHLFHLGVTGGTISLKALLPMRDILFRHGWQGGSNEYDRTRQECRGSLVVDNLELGRSCRYARSSSWWWRRRRHGRRQTKRSKQDDKTHDKPIVDRTRDIFLVCKQWYRKGRCGGSQRARLLCVCFGFVRKYISLTKMRLTFYVRPTPPSFLNCVSVWDPSYYAKPSPPDVKQTG